MNRREKLLLTLVVSVVGIFVLGFGVRWFLLKPLRDIDKTTANLQAQLNKAKEDRRAFFANEEVLKKYNARAFADDVDQASARAGEMLTRAILECGLRETDFTRLPANQRKLRLSENREIGWSVQGEGSLQRIVDLLFVLQESPYLSRVEGVQINATDRPGHVKVRFRYLTLVLNPAPEVQRVPLSPAVNLASVERKLYDPLIARDILRPYIKRPPPPPPPPPAPVAPPAAEPTTPPGPPPPGLDTFRIISLSEWQGQSEVHVRDLTHQRINVHKPGEPLAGGTIVMVDYRSLPRPDQPLLLSHSRVIIRVENDYWAIERGQTLAQKYQLTPEQLPPQLSEL
jgi:hypothetical protein